MGYTYTDEKVAEHLERNFTSAFISGSYLTNPDEANDIDVVVSDSAFQLNRAAVSDANFVREAQEKEEQYQEGTDDMYELVSCWRKNGVNLIVVNDLFYPAYKAAQRIMSERPELFNSRSKRVALHHRLKAHVREMFGEAAWTKFSQSPVPVQSFGLE